MDFYPPPPNNENHSVLTGQIILWPAPLGTPPTTLTLAFDKDDNSLSDAVRDCYMANLVKAALEGKSEEEKAALTTIQLTGEAPSITGYNWECLRDLYRTDSIFKGLPKLSILDLSAMNDLTSIGNPEGRGGMPSKLTEIRFPSGLTSIEKKAFWNCTGLTKLTLPDSLTSIAANAFYECTSLTEFSGSDANPSFEIQEGILYGKGMHTLFRYPPGKTAASFQVPDTVDTICAGAFYGCSNLTKITFPGSLQSIGDYAFHACSKLTEIIFPGSLQSIGDNAFHACPRLTEVTFSGSLLSIGDYAFRSCSKLTEVTFSGSLLSIGDSAFYDCSELTTVTFSGSLLSIGHYAFFDCSKLTGITFPGSLLSIGDSAFFDCSSLTEVTFSGSLQSIGDYAFYSCSSLTSLTFKGYAPPSIGNGAFYGIVSTGTIYYPIRSGRYTGDWKDNTLGLTHWTLESQGTLPPPHSHSYGDWRFDGQEHWRECTCGSRDSLAAHTYGEWTTDLPGGSRKRTCTVCAYEETNALPVPALRVTERTASSVSLAWEAVVGAQGYTVWYRSEHENKVSRRIIPGGDVTTWSHQRLAPGTKYFYALRAWVSTETGYLFGEQSPVQRGTTKPEAAVIQAVTAKDGKIKVTLAGGAKGAEYYSMCYSKAADFGDFQVGRRTRHTTRTFREALPKGTYYIRVKSCRELGNGKRVYGEWSNPVKLRVK